ncbi:MAG: HD domain-containing phosphohydrolase [Steroidobacter sp.]
MGVILIAFERESEQSTLEQLLAGKGHRVVKAANGLAALDVARREPPDLIVSDIVLPRMDGFALCRKWKQDERLQAVPFVFYTRRHDDPKYERFALELGAERFLARSTHPEALATAVDELLANLPAKSNPTTPLPTLDGAALERAAAKEQQRTTANEQAQLEAQAQALMEAQTQAHTQALERAQEAQARLRSQLQDLEATNQRLAAGEARFRRVFEANPLPMWIADHATGGFIAVNDAALVLFGYNRAEFLGQKSTALLLAGVEPSGDVRMHQRKDGAALALSTASHEIEFDGRNADLVCAYDLSERVAIERQLHERAATGRAVLDAAADGCWVLDGESRILDVNDAYCRMSGYSREELLNMTATQIEDQSAGETTMRLQLGRVSGGGRYETKHRRQDGALMDVEVSVGLLGNARGDSVVMIRDSSQRRRELVAQRTAQRQTEFLVALFRQSGSFDESAIVQRVIDQAAEATHSPLAFLYFVNPEHKTLALAAWRERGQSHITMADAEPRPLSHASLFTECVRARHVTSSNDPGRKPQGDGLPDLQRYIAAPMIENDETVAVLGVANREAGYGEEDQRALVVLADGVWRVLHAKRAHAQTLSSLQRTDVALQGMIDSFVRVSERHDPYTAGSARRLAALAVALGREAGLDGERQHALRVAALLHDVGNIAVPASILSKPAPLTETELALMRTHVEEGCQLLADIDFGAPIADIVYQSHERYDGSGYPRGLKGEEILLEARILGIADTVEAMCSPRPYRPAAGMDAAIDEINRGAGRLYDLHIVAACTRLVRQHGFTLPE